MFTGCHTHVYVSKCHKVIRNPELTYYRVATKPMGQNSRLFNVFRKVFSVKFKVFVPRAYVISIKAAIYKILLQTLKNV